MGDFVRKLPGVNSNRIKADLMDLGYLYRKQAGVYKVRSAFRDKLFAEQFDYSLSRSAACVCLSPGGWRQALQEATGA